MTLTGLLVIVPALIPGKCGRIIEVPFIWRKAVVETLSWLAFAIHIRLLLIALGLTPHLIYKPSCQRATPLLVYPNYTHNWAYCKVGSPTGSRNQLPWMKIMCTNRYTIGPLKSVIWNIFFQVSNLGSRRFPLVPSSPSCSDQGSRCKSILSQRNRCVLLAQVCCLLHQFFFSLLQNDVYLWMLAGIFQHNNS